METTVCNQGQQEAWGAYGLSQAHRAKLAEGGHPGAAPHGLGNCTKHSSQGLLHRRLLHADCHFSAAGRQRTQACNRVADTWHLDQGCFHQ